MIHVTEHDRLTSATEGTFGKRYGSVDDCTGRLLIYDLENTEAWVRGDASVSLEGYR